MNAEKINILQYMKPGRAYTAESLQVELKQAGKIIERHILMQLLRDMADNRVIKKIHDAGRLKFSLKIKRQRYR